MTKTVALDRLYADYSAGRLGRKTFEGMIFRAIREKVPALPGLNREEVEDFISWLYPRFSSAVDRYRATGSTFEAYIRALVRRSAMEYRHKHVRAHHAEIAAWTTEVPYAHLRERESGNLESLEAAAARAAELKCARNSRQLLMLLLKCCMHVSDDFVERISPNLGMQPAALNSMIESLKAQREKREKKIEDLRSLANYQLCRCLFHERTLRATRGEPALRQEVKEHIRRSRGKLSKTRERLASLRMDPSNAQIADILGVKKGSVDAALHALKARWKFGRGDLLEQSRHILN